MSITKKLLFLQTKIPGDGHFAVSIVKSIFRFVASALLCYAGYSIQRTTILISLLQMQDF